MSQGKQRPLSHRPQLEQRARALSASASWSEACTAWAAVINHDKHDPGAWANLALARAHAGLYPEAIDAYAKAMQYGHPADEVAAGMGLVFCLRQQYDIARENLEIAVASNPNNLGAWSNLVVAYVRLGLVQRAFQAAERVLETDPNNASVFSSLGTLCKDMGMADEAIAWLQRAADAAPQSAYTVSNILWAMLHSDTVSAQDILAQARKFDSLTRIQTATPSPPRSANTRLKIGWLSGDLRNHAVGLFVVPILEKLNRDAYESTVYNTSHLCDELSQRAQSVTHAWHNVAQLSDTQIAKRIQSDGIDILIDLAGHTDGSRLAVLAHRPAPVQISWLGYPGTTGLSAVDYIIIPPDSTLQAGAWCSEKPLPLPDCYCARNRDELAAQDDAKAPCENNRFISFGCLNNFAKVSPSCLAVWANILSQIPDSKLILVATGGSDADFVSDIRERFAVYDIDPARLDIRGRMNNDTYRTTFREIDIGLDPFPFNGGTTGFDSLCMGTPYITLEGESLHARMGANLLRPIGLENLIATTVDEYIAKAVALAQEPNTLSQLHAGMRTRMMNSPLMDPTRFARGLEKLLETTLLRPCNTRLQNT